MIEQSLTSGAIRALEKADHFARNDGDESTDPHHLLEALIDEESRAAEILLQHGITAELMIERKILPKRKAAELPSSGPGDGGSGQFPRSESLQQVIVEARQQAARVGRHAEVGTEYLLMGISVVDGKIGEVLAEQGLDVAELREVADEQSGFSSEPIEVDLHITQPQPEGERTDLLRVVDAAANRASEGLRVVEDYVRFVLDDEHLVEQLKSLRHDLSALLESLPTTQLLAARDTPQDVGTTISTPREFSRTSADEIVRANFKRAQEALRTLEEFGKLLSADIAEPMQHLRYRLYTIEKGVEQTTVSRDELSQCLVYLLATDECCHHGCGPAIHGALEGGVRIVQLREKDWPDRRIIEQGRRVREWTSRAGALFIMNDRPDLAVVLGADGVHVGQEELSVREARRILGPDRLVGVSTHTIEQARQAVLDGADYLGVGPVFSSSTKEFTDLAGLEFVAQVAREITLPWFAIGGITAENVSEVIEAGATRIAVCSEICSAEDPAAATRELVSLLAADRPKG